MKKLKDFFTALLFITARFFFKILPESMRVCTGKIAGLILKNLSSKRRNICYDNISNSFPDNTQSENNIILKTAYQNLGITLVESLVLDTYRGDKLRQKIRIENIDLIKRLQAKGRGLILLSAHLGNWELLAFAAGLLSKRQINIIIKYQMNPYTDKMLKNLRRRGGNKLIDMKKAGRKVISLLKENEIVALLADQRAAPESSIRLDFFGREASVYKTPALLALKYNSPIILGFAVRDEKGNYVVKLKEIDYADLKNNEEGIKQLTKRYLEELEDVIRKHPGQWVWQHKRWEIPE